MERPGDTIFVMTRDGDVYVFSGIEDAEGYMEAIDVLDGEYVDLFRIDGERLSVSGSEKDYRVVIERTGSFELGALVDRLCSLAERNGFDGDNPDLRAIANEILANEWRVRWPRWPRWLSVRAHGEGPPSV